MQTVQEEPQDLSDLIFSVQTKLEKMGLVVLNEYGPHRRYDLKDDRILNWAIAVLQHPGMGAYRWSAEELHRLLENHPRERHWWAVRQFLPESAWSALEAKLDKALQEQDGQPNCEAA